jgi:hypothetical protein
MKKYILIILFITSLLISFTGPVKKWLKYPKVFDKANFNVLVKPKNYKEWDYYYLKQMKDSTNFWNERIKDVDSNNIQYQNEYKNIMEFVNNYRQSKGMTELKYSRKLSLEAELSQYYNQMYGIELSNSNSAINHYINSKLFYCVSERSETIEKNITFEKDVKIVTEIVTGEFSTDKLRNKYSPEALEYYKKYNWAAKFIISPGHHSCLLKYDLNNIGFYVKNFGGAYNIIIVLGKDRDNEYKPEFDTYRRDAIYYTVTQKKYQNYMISIMKGQKVTDYKFY